MLGIMQCIRDKKRPVFGNVPTPNSTVYVVCSLGRRSPRM